MTDDTMKDLVTKHDLTITQLVQSVEHLVTAQTETNKRLEEISGFLAKQAVFTSRLETMDKELRDSFKRVHKRVDEIENLQKTDTGCNSVKLLHKDVESLTKDTTRLVGAVEENRIMYEKLKSTQDKSPPPALIKWVISLMLAYSIMFGTYVVQTFSKLEQTNALIVTKLERDIKDTMVLSELVRILDRKVVKYEKLEK